MRFSRIVFLFLCAAFGALTGNAQAQHWRGNIPFSFKIKNQAFQPGMYDISLDVSRGLVSLSNNSHASDHIMWIGVPSDRNVGATMRFVLVGDAYVLTSVAAGNWQTPRPRLPGNAQEATVVFPQ
jgi:hypothetical protein